MGVSGTNAQVIKPIKVIVNDNILRNSNLKLKENDSTLYWSTSIGNIQYYNNDFDAFIAAPNPTTYEVDITDSNQFDGIGKGGLVLSCQAVFGTSDITASNIWGDCMVETIIGGAAQGQYCDISSKIVNGNTINVIFELNNLNFENLMKVHIAELNLKSAYPFKIIKLKLETGYTATPYCPSIYDNIKWDYEQYGASFQSQKLGDILNITEYQYKKSLTDVGLFSMTIPLDTPFADEIAEDYYLFVDKKDWLLVQDVKKTETGYAITGTDLKGILATRITLYDVVNDTMGFDSVNGSTEECCKHYVLNNVINPTDGNRTVPLVTLAHNQNRGIVADTYMSRFEYLHEVIKKLCENAKIGYTMYADVMNNKIIFDIVDIVDKTVDQQDRNRVVFDVKNKNVTSYERVKGNSTYKNAFYATKSGGGLETDATTKLCLRDSAAPKGIARKEIHLNVSCESVADIETYAKYQYKDYAKIDSLVIAPADVKGYGVIFDVGDMVTQKIDDEYVNTVIQSAEITYSGNNYNVTINFGDEQPQPLKYLKTMINNKGV